MSLTFEQYNGDQVIQLLTTDTLRGDKRIVRSGLAFNDRADGGLLTAFYKNGKRHYLNENTFAVYITNLPKPVKTSQSRNSQFSQ
ncbi:hypothetical protein [Pseudoalteromonas sp. NBT06-2]|uniref:hypothetical protein n=1 Tax=Pseudoalteromonas sp. NBT06-2 TaxID=2025950 RepID=UPI001BAE7F28|nr:hypothetical protein [Pseudoalteromonas sp. NBT06-2]